MEFQCFSMIQVSFFVNKSIQNMKNRCQVSALIFGSKLHHFLIDVGAILGPQKVLIWTPNLIKIFHKILIDFWPLLAPFWLPFGEHLGNLWAPFLAPWNRWRPSWHHPDLQSGPQTLLGPKNGAFWTPFPPFWPKSSSDFNVFWNFLNKYNHKGHVK